MADLGNLWFSLGLDDSKFEKQWQAAYNKYKQQANIDVRLAINNQDLNTIQNRMNTFMKGFNNNNAKAKIDIEVTPNTIQALQALRGMGGTKADWALVKEAAKALREVSKTAVQAAKDQERLNNQINKGQKKVNANYNAQSLWLQNLSTLASNYFSLYAVKNFVTELAQVSGEFEKQRVTLQAMVGEMQGLEIYGKMKELSVVSPFEFKDLASYAKQLAAFSVPYEELYDTTKRLADVSAGLGVDMSRIILAYGQIRSAGVLRGTELRQLTEAGVPILEKLAAKFTELEGKAVSVGDVFGKISKKMVSFEMVKDVFTELTSEGGKFYNMQEIQAETLSGKIANLKDAYAIMLSEIGESNEGLLKGGVEILYKLINNWETLGRVIMSVAVAYGAYQAAQMLAFAGDKLQLIGTFVKKFLELEGSIKKTAEAMATMNLASKAGVYGAIAAAIFGIGTALYQAYKAANKFNRELDDIYSRQTIKLEQEERALEKIKEALDGAAEGSQNRRDAINQFNNQFGSYLQNMLTETSTVNELAIAYNNVAEGIKNKNKQEALANANIAIEEEYGSKVSDTLKELRVSLMGKGLSSREAGDVLTLLQDYYAKGGSKLKEINKIITDRIGKDLFKQTNLGVSNALTEKLKSTLRVQVQEYEDALKKAIEDVDVRFNSNLYSTKEEADFVNKVETIYQTKLAQLKAQEGLSQAEFDKQAKELESIKLQELAEGYGAMGLTEKANEYLAQWEKLVNITTGWRKDIADLISSFSTEDMKIPTFFNPKEDETWLEYVDRIKKEYKELKESIENIGTDPDNELPALKAQKNALEAVAKAYKIVLDAKGDKKAETQAEKAERLRVNKLKEQYEWLLKIAQAYDKLTKQDASPEIAKKSIFNTFTDIPEDIKTALTNNNDWVTWFAEQFKALSDEAKKNGSDVGENLSNAILQKVGTLNVGDVVQALKLGEQIKAELEKWGLEDYALQGEGVTLDISKALRDQRVAYNEAYRRRQELLDKVAKAERGDAAEIAALKEMYGEKWLENAKNRANELYDLEIANNKKIAEEKISDLTKAYAKEKLEDLLPQGFMSSLGDKSIKQLKEAKEKLVEAAEEIPEFVFDDKFTDLFKDLDINWDKLIEKYQEYLKLQGKDVSDEIIKKKQKEVEFALELVKQLVGSLKSLAEENSALEGVLEGLEASLDAADAAWKGYQAGGVWGAIAAGVVSITTSVIKQIAAAKQYREEMERAADSFQNSITLTRRGLKIAGDEFNTIFGEDLLSAFKADSEAITDIARQLKNASKEVANMKVTTRKGFFGIGNKKTTLQDLAPQLFNADGSVNYSYLDEFLDAYGDKLSEDQKLILENLKSTYQQYEDAMADINDYVSGIFSNTASTIADRMLESFATTGNAATELGDLVSGVAKQMAKDLIQSLLVDQYLAPAMDRIKSLYNPQDKAYEEDATLRTQKAILAVQDAMAAAQAAVPEVNKLLQAIQDMGIDLGAESENASEVLSGLTEDQQNLLVSYINGIRADVSMNKGLLTTIVNSVGTISNNIATAIVVWKQIEANTHRSADGVDRIIGFFESVMGPYDGGGGQAFRVNIA